MKVRRGLALPRAFAVAVLLASALGPQVARGAQEHPSGHARSVEAAEHAGEAAADEAAEAEEHEGPGPINWLDFSNKKQPPYAAALINFVLLAILYYSFGKKPVAEALKLRRATVAKQIEEAQRMKREAEERAKHYQAKLLDLSKELEATKRALEDAGKGERDRIVREAEEKAARMEKDAAFMVEQELKQMRLDLMRETVDVSVAVAEELLRKRVTQADHERLADEFLASLAARKPVAAAGSGAGSGGAS
jgi:F-type H+-transporting ATPase subunit b